MSETNAYGNFFKKKDLPGVIAAIFEINNPSQELIEVVFKSFGGGFIPRALINEPVILSQTQALLAVEREVGFINPHKKYLPWYYVIANDRYLRRFDFAKLAERLNEKNLVEEVTELYQSGKIRNHGSDQVIVQIRSIIKDLSGNAPDLSGEEEVSE